MTDDGRTYFDAVLAVEIADARCAVVNAAREFVWNWTGTNQRKLFIAVAALEAVESRANAPERGGEVH